MREPHNYPLSACTMSLYPVHDSLLEAVQYIEAQAPIEPHEVFPLLMRYHNSLIQEIDRDQSRPVNVPVSLIK